MLQNFLDCLSLIGRIGCVPRSILFVENQRHLSRGNAEVARKHVRNGLLTPAGPKGITHNGLPKLPGELGLDQEDYANLCHTWFNGNQRRHTPGQAQRGKQVSILMTKDDLKDLKCLRVFGFGFRIQKISNASKRLQSGVRSTMYIQLPYHDSDITLEHRFVQSTNDAMVYLNNSLAYAEAVKMIQSMASEAGRIDAFKLFETESQANSPIEHICKLLRAGATLSMRSIHDNGLRGC
jgi:hypothetical protein